MTTVEELGRRAKQASRQMNRMGTKQKNQILALAAQALVDILRSLHENGVDIVLCGLPSSAMNMMHRSGIYDMVGEQGFYWSVERALLDLRPYTGKK